MGSSGTQFTERNEESSIDPKEILSTRNINVAKMAIKDRSPSYLNQKLVSQTSLQDNTARVKLNAKLTKKQSEKIEAEVNEHVL